MEEVDYEAALLANKALSIIFIILIVSLNGILILKTVRKPKFFLSPKCMLIISLAIGDIIFALFPLVIYAKVLFGDSAVTCVTRETTEVYHDFVISFAYGVGVITLALELVFRYKRKNMVAGNLQAVVAFIYNFLPWFFVLVFVLPLTMAGIIWETCTYPISFFPLSRFYAMYWMCEIVPPVLAFIVCFVIMFIKLTPRQESFNPGLTGVGLGDYNSGPGTANQTQNFPVQQQHLNATTTTTNGKVTFQAQVNSYNTPKQNYPPQQLQFVVPSVTQPQFPNNSTTQPQFSNTSTTQPQFPNNSTTHSQFPNNSTNPTREKTLLLVVAIINLVCVLPYGAFRVSDLTILSEYVLITLLYTFLWVFRLRSLLTPIIWFFDR